MDADRRSAVLTGVFLLLGTVVGVIGLGVVLEPLNSATDHLTLYGQSETRVLVASLVELFMGGCSCRHGDRRLSRAQEVQSQRGDRVYRRQAP